MRIVVEAVSKGKNGIPLPETSLVFESGRVTVVAAETGDQPTVLSLIASGRMVPDSGSVTLDGVADAASARERIALVDAPDVSDPSPDLLLRSVVIEELMYAGRSTSRDTVAAVIDQAGGAAFAAVRMGDVPPAVRVRILAEVAAFRRGVRGVVITSPDRHGGDPREWLAVATDLADRDFAVLVVCGAASAEIIAPLLPPRPAASEPEAALAVAPAEATAATASPAPAPTPTPIGTEPTPTPAPASPEATPAPADAGSAEAGESATASPAPAGAAPELAPSEATPPHTAPTPPARAAHAAAPPAAAPAETAPAAPAPAAPASTTQPESEPFA
ncbi:hypothetical protein N1027_03770 [Herbiconiux sp. CPCC 205763]|uniref:ABC transporter ATP-binding protein n=1 Tax=Herbiconiux aconitum TaxID=2970913 RepID=A0ABT2GLY9_9MICO|nr:hypothetical protein [Herbiconiux aconitum]MCS5717251.1 hypothetical protein [Herbiconiux aconitum]